MTTVRMFVQYAVQNDMMIHQLDVKTAYLNTPIDCDVYISQPDGFKISHEDKNIVWKLKKSLYGLKQSGRNWNIVLNNFFKSKGLEQSEVDPCLFTLNQNTYVVVWVDDIIIACNTMELMDKLKNELKTTFKMKDLGPISYFLGLQFEQNNEGILMNQTHYLQKLFE